MSSTKEERGGISLEFEWTPEIEELCASWRREVASAGRLHRLAAERLRLRHVAIGSLLVVTTVFTAAAATAMRYDRTALAYVGLDDDRTMLVIAVAASIAAALALIQTFARFAVRAERHRVAALRYASLDRRISGQLALPRAARREPDRVMAETQERMRRYGEGSPVIRRRLRRASVERTIEPAVELDRTRTVPATVA